ncbi:MAG TPA: glycosyltransferase family 1 protein [Verrucomicrobiae bacterium]
MGQYLLALTKALIEAETEHQFTLFVLEEDLPLFEFARDSVKLVPVAERYRPAVKNILWHQAILPGLVRHEQIDVLHIPSYRRMLWRQPCPMVATIHDLAPLRVKGKYDWKRTFYASGVVKHLARRQDHIISVSKHTAEDIQHFFHLPQPQITVIHNGVDHQRYSAIGAQASKKLIAERYGLKQPFFLYISRLEHPAKNHVRLIQAFEMFQEKNSPWQLVFAGSDWNGADVIHNAISKSRCKNSIHSLGFVPDEVVPDLMRAADVFVYPSLYEGFGLPIAEAMACGAPVICSNCSSMLEVAGDAAATADPENVVALKWQLLRLAGNPRLREQLSQAGLQQARLFDWKRTASATLKIYEQVARKEACIRTSDLIANTK